MNINDFYYTEGEQPLDRLVSDGGFCAIFRTIACIGDSLSSGEFEGLTREGVKSWHDLYEYSWGQYLARMCGSTVLNFSKGGMSAGAYNDSFAPEKGFFDPAKACQAYIIAMGVNDISGVIGGGLEFGNMDDICEEDLNNCKRTFAGNYGRMFLKYKAIAPNAKFFLMTAPRGTENEERAALYDRHQEFLYQLAERFPNTYVLDLRKYGPVYDEKFRENFFMGGHMNPMGYVLTAKMVASYIDFIIRRNPADFMQVGFINTPFRNCDYKI